jgi:hypothetical protein
MAAPIQHRVNTRLITFLAIFGLVVLGMWGVWRLSIFGQAPSKLTAELRAAHADGLPTDVGEIRQATYAPDSQNAAPLLKLAFAELKEEQKNQSKDVLKIGGHSGGISKVTPAELDEIAPAISQETKFFEILRAAVSRPKLDFRRPWESGPAMLLPECAEEKSCVSQLILKAKVDAKSGKTLSALDALDTAAKLSALAGQEPLIIGLLIECSMKQMVCEELTEILKAHASEPAVLDQCKLVLNDFGPQPDVRPAIRSEFVLGRISVNLLSKSTVNASDFGGGDSVTGVIRLARFGPIRTIFDLRYTQIYHNLYKRLSERPQSLVAMQKAFQETNDQMNQKSGKDWTYGLADILAPVFTGMAGAIGEAEAKRNLIRCAVDLFHAKLTVGHFPDKLLGNSGYWTDPLSEKPMKYHLTKDGFLIYSVGKDGVDDGGKPRPKNATGGENYDIPFRFP